MVEGKWKPGRDLDSSLSIVLSTITHCLCYSLSLPSLLLLHLLTPPQPFWRAAQHGRLIRPTTLLEAQEQTVNRAPTFCPRRCLERQCDHRHCCPPSRTWQSTSDQKEIAWEKSRTRWNRGSQGNLCQCGQSKPPPCSKLFRSCTNLRSSRLHPSRYGPYLSQQFL